MSGSISAGRRAVAGVFILTSFVAWSLAGGCGSGALDTAPADPSAVQGVATASAPIPASNSPGGSAASDQSASTTPSMAALPLVTAADAKRGGVFLNAVVAGANQDLTGRIAADARIAGVQLDVRWTDLEPARGQFDWRFIDEALSNYSAVGKRVALRFWAVGLAADLKTDITPAWLWDEESIASVGERDTPAGKAPRLPVYWDENYLRLLGEFLAAFGARYDGDPDLAYIRMGGWQCGTNEPNFYGDLSVYLSDQLAAHGMTLAAAGSRALLSADQPYTTATLRMVDLWHASFPRTQLIATIHFSDDPADFDYALVRHCLSLGVGMMNTGLNEGDKSDARARFRAWRDANGVRAGWGGVSNLGQKNPTLSGLPLRLEMVRQGTGIDADPAYAPAARAAYMVFGPDILDFPEALEYAADHVAE